MESGTNIMKNAPFKNLTNQRRPKVLVWSKGLNKKKRILHDCSCFIEFIKRVWERDKTRGLPKNRNYFR